MPAVSVTTERLTHPLRGPQCGGERCASLPPGTASTRRCSVGTPRGLSSSGPGAPAPHIIVGARDPGPPGRSLAGSLSALTRTLSRTPSVAPGLEAASGLRRMRQGRARVQAREPRMRERGAAHARGGCAGGRDPKFSYGAGKGGKSSHPSSVGGTECGWGFGLDGLEFSRTRGPRRSSWRPLQSPPCFSSPTVTALG